MAEIVNLRRHRKAKQRAAAAATAADNRVAFGLSKRERAEAAGERARQERRVDGARLEREPPDGSDA